jgi:hypothetical protein
VARVLGDLADRIRPTRPDPVIGLPEPTTPSDKIWAAAAATYLTTHADKVRENAGKWGASAAAILAIVGLSTVFKGRETLESIAPEYRSDLVIVVVVATICAGLALFTAAIAAQGIPGEGWSDPDSFRRAQLNSARTSRKWLDASRTLVVGAFAVSLGGMLLIWTRPEAPASPGQTLVVGEGGAYNCGKLTVKGGQLLVGDSALPAPPLAFYTLTECPGP